MLRYDQHTYTEYEMVCINTYDNESAVPGSLAVISL